MRGKTIPSLALLLSALLVAPDAWAQRSRGASPSRGASSGASRSGGFSAGAIQSRGASRGVSPSRGSSSPSRGFSQSRPSTPSVAPTSRSSGFGGSRGVSSPATPSTPRSGSYSVPGSTRSYPRPVTPSTSPSTGRTFTPSRPSSAAPSAPAVSPRSTSPYGNYGVETRTLAPTALGPDSSAARGPAASRTDGYGGRTVRTRFPAPADGRYGGRPDAGVGAAATRGGVSTRLDASGAGRGPASSRLAGRDLARERREAILDRYRGDTTSAPPADRSGPFAGRTGDAGTTRGDVASGRGAPDRDVAARPEATRDVRAGRRGGDDARTPPASARGVVPRDAEGRDRSSGGELRDAPARRLARRVEDGMGRDPERGRDVLGAGQRLAEATRETLAVGVAVATGGNSDWYFADPGYPGHGGHHGGHHGGFWYCPPWGYSYWYGYWGGHYGYSWFCHPFSWWFYYGYGYWPYYVSFYPSYAYYGAPGYYASVVHHYYYEDDDEVVYVEVPAEEAAPLEEAPLPAASGPVPPPAQGELEELLDGAPDSRARTANHYLTQGDQAFAERRYADAVHFYTKAAAFAPEEGVLFLVLSDALLATGDYHYGAYALRRALAIDPSLAESEVDKHTFYTDPAEFDRQLGVLDAYLADRPSDHDARLLLAANYLFGGRPSDCVRVLEDPRGAALREQEAARLLLETARRRSR